MVLYPLTFRNTTDSEMRSRIVGIMTDRPLVEGATSEGHSITTPSNVAALKEWAEAGTIRGTIEVCRDMYEVTLTFEQFHSVDFEHSQVHYAFTCIHLERVQS